MSQYKGLVYSAHEYNFTKVFTGYQQSHMKVKSIWKVKFKSTILYKKKLRTTFSDSFRISLYVIYRLLNLKNLSSKTDFWIYWQLGILLLSTSGHIVTLIRLKKIYQDFSMQIKWSMVNDYYDKVHIFWEGHKNLRNFQLTSVLCSASQKK